MRRTQKEGFHFEIDPEKGFDNLVDMIASDSNIENRNAILYVLIGKIFDKQSVPGQLVTIKTLLNKWERNLKEELKEKC